MMIQKKVTVLLIMFIVIIVSTILLQISITEQIKSMLHQDEIAERLMKDIFELTILSQDLQKNDSPRAVSQWQKKYHTLLSNLNEANHTLSEKDRIHIIEQKLIKLRRFADLVIKNETKPELRSHYSNKLIIQSIELQNETNKITIIARKNINDIQSKGRKVMFLLAFFLVCFMIGIISIIIRKILFPIRIFQQGFSTIGKGDLSHQIQIKSNDEFGLLAKDVNTMTSKLKQTLASRNELQNEIDKRKQAEIQMNLALQKVQESNAELEQFAFVASHDLQEPLRKISSFTSLLEHKLEDHLDEKMRKYMFYITDGAKRMQQLIDDLLKLSRIKTQGKAFEVVNLNEILIEVKEILEHRIQEKNVTIKSSDLPNVWGDRMQISLLMRNLISNAIKYNQNTTPEINISASSIDHFYKIEIKDNGIGINKEHLGKVFQIFHRAHIGSEYEGSGIGLAICKKIVSRHQGTISVESEVEKGSTFTFTLPKIQEEK